MNSALTATIATPRLQRVSGKGSIGTRTAGGRTRIMTLYQEGAANIRLPRTHDATIEAALINTAGGLTGGDRLIWNAEAGAGSRLLLTTPAAERIYRSPAADVVVEACLAAGPGARLDWIPQETILFEGARLDRRFEIDLAGDATLFMVEAVLLGRQAMGEDAGSARLTDNWRIRRGGRLIHAEASRLDADPRQRQNLSLLAGANAFATLLYLGKDAEQRREALRNLPDHAGLGHSLLGQRLVVRLLAPSGLALRRLLIPIIAVFSEGTALPRLWHL